MSPCGVSYHTDCFRVGAPFSSRLAKGAGLVFPRVRQWGTFICELCTVRANVGRELHCPTDVDLLRFERMRVIDMANAWAHGTHKVYQQKLAVIRGFQLDHQFSFLGLPPLPTPPISVDIPLMWIHESYSLRTSSKHNDTTVAFATIRHLRSAASQLLGWEMLVRDPSSTFQDTQQNVIQLPCRPTDSYSFTLFTKGMSGRLGTASSPATPLLFRHVLYMDRTFNANYKSASSLQSKRQWAMAGVANLILWLGWLRSTETFSLTWADVSMVLPEDGPSQDLPLGMGMVLLQLLAQTKTNRSATADVVIAFTTKSGFSLGRWLRRLSFVTTGSYNPPSSSLPIFCDSDGSPWSSNLFRTQFVFPCLYQLQAGGDAFLRAFVGEGNTIPDKFWSLHMYRRGARTHVGRGGTHDGVSFKKASKAQTFEHGRWRLKRSAMAIDQQYNEWPYAERILITLLCQ